MIKESIPKEDKILSIYASSIEAPQYMSQILTNIKREIDGNTIIVGNFNTPLTPKDRLSNKINKETQALNNALFNLHKFAFFAVIFPVVDT